MAERLEAAVEAVGWGGPPLLVGLGDGADDRAAGPLPAVGGAGDDPVADLLGYTVPADCSGLGVVAEGTGRRLVGPVDQLEPEAGVPYRFAYVLHRDGRAGCAVRARGAPPRVDGFHDGAADGPGGRLVDVCHRALGLSTAPPSPSTARAWLLCWLDTLLERALGRDGPTMWPDAARLHPVLTLLADAERGPAPTATPGAGELGRLGRALGSVLSWAELREAVVDRDWTVHGIRPADAEWMDDGMFDRWVTGEYLPVDVYLAELGELLPSAVVRRVARVAEATR